MDSLGGGKLAGYEIETELGRGGMGVVYLARDGRLNRRVALKVLTPDLARNERFQERFKRESQLAAAIDHPNIIPIYEAGESEGVLYIAMRYVEGEDLKAVLKREGRLEVDKAVGILRQVASALDAAHLRGLVHRDVKPANVLVASGQGEETDHVYLTDFGLTKRALSSEGLTETGMFVGTIDYVAPEQIQGVPLDGRADVYALGCMLYECLTGALPFVKESELATIWAHLRDPPPEARRVRPDLPTGIDTVLARSMAKSPDERFASCRELVTAARMALGGVVHASDESAAPSVAGTARACPACHAGLEPGDHFCVGCGTEVNWCPHCGAPHLPGDAFCVSCGGNLA